LRAYLAALVALTLLLGGIAAWYQTRTAAAAASGDAMPPPVVVAAATARLESWSRHLDAVGSLRAAQGVELTSEASGEIIALHFDSGEQVQAGQLMVVLNDTVETASRENQRAALELATLLHQRDATLIGQKSIPQSQYDRTRAAWQQARAQLAETEALLAQKRITAPFAGTAGIRRVDLGDYVEPGTVITSLQDLEHLEVDFSVPSQSALLLRPGLPVEVRVDAHPDRVFAAELLALDSRIDTGTQNLEVRARLAPGSGLIPGMFVAVRVMIDAQTEVVTVPETAISYSLHGNTVHVLGPDTDGAGRSQEPVVVEVGEGREGRIEIRSGLQPGATVVSAGQNKLYRGARVRVDGQVAP
jgi:membrane fusion protein (multidrug efflux system)